MKTLLRTLNVIVFLPIVLLGYLYLLWYYIDDEIVKHYRKDRIVK